MIFIFFFIFFVCERERTKKSILTDTVIMSIHNLVFRSFRDSHSFEGKNCFAKKNIPIIINSSEIF